MFKSALVLASLAAAAFGSQAHAEVYTCVFAKPLVTVVYDTTTETLTTSGFDEIFFTPNGTPRDITTTDIVYRKNEFTGEINFVNGKGVVLYFLIETGKGTDGVSHATYPFEVIANASPYLPKFFLGGCYTSSQPKIEPVPGT